MPPKGSRGSDLTISLIKMLPDWMWLAICWAWSSDEDQMLAPRP